MSLSPVTIVVGATGALGRPIVARLVQDGHHVVAVARSADALERLHTEIACDVVVADAGSDDSVAAITSALDGRPVRMVVFLPAAPNAGHVLTANVDDLMAAFNVKVGGLVRVLRAVEDALTSDARIVAVGGSLGFDPIPDASSAGLANAALANLVRQLQRALGPRGVSVHLVAPGPVETERWRSMAEGEAARRGVSLDVVRSEVQAATPMGRLTTTDEVAWAVALLADPHASALAGSTLILDAGRRTAIP